MRDYRIYLIGANGRIQRGDDASCPDDEAALPIALEVVAEHGLAEVWTGTRRLYAISTNVERLRPWGWPLTVREGCSIIAFQ